MCSAIARGGGATPASRRKRAPRGRARVAAAVPRSPHCPARQGETAPRGVGVLTGSGVVVQPAQQPEPDAVAVAQARRVMLLERRQVHTRTRTVARTHTHTRTRPHIHTRAHTAVWACVRARAQAQAALVAIGRAADAPAAAAAAAGDDAMPAGLKRRRPDAGACLRGCPPRWRALVLWRTARAPQGPGRPTPWASSAHHRHGRGSRCVAWRVWGGVTCAWLVRARLRTNAAAADRGCGH